MVGTWLRYDETALVALSFRVLKTMVGTWLRYDETALVALAFRVLGTTEPGLGMIMKQL